MAEKARWTDGQPEHSRFDGIVHRLFDNLGICLRYARGLLVAFARQLHHPPPGEVRLKGGARLGFWFFVESLASMSSTGEMSRRLRIQCEGAIYHVMASASPSPTGR